MREKHWLLTAAILVILLPGVGQVGQASVITGNKYAEYKVRNVINNASESFISGQALALAASESRVVVSSFWQSITNEGENILILLLGLILLLTFTAIRLWPARNNRRSSNQIPSETD